MTLGIVVPSQLDIESQHDDDGSCSLILDRLSHITYLPNPHCGVEERDHPTCERKRRENVLVLSFPNVLDAKHFFEYLCNSEEHLWEMIEW